MEFLSPHGCKENQQGLSMTHVSFLTKNKVLGIPNYQVSPISLCALQFSSIKQCTVIRGSAPSHTGTMEIHLMKLQAFLMRCPKKQLVVQPSKHGLH